MKFAFVGIGFAFLISTMNSCYYDNEEELYGMVVCDTSAVSFKNDIEPIIQNNCATTGCHVAGGTGTGIFINYAGLKEKVDNGSLIQRTVVIRDMPKGFSLTECQVNFISAWVAAGAPNN